MNPDFNDKFEEAMNAVFWSYVYGSCVIKCDQSLPEEYSNYAACLTLLNIIRELKDWYSKKGKYPSTPDWPIEKILSIVLNEKSFEEKIENASPQVKLYFEVQ